MFNVSAAISGTLWWLWLNHDFGKFFPTFFLQLSQSIDRAWWEVYFLNNADSPPPRPRVSIFKKFPSQTTCMYCTSIRMQIYTFLLFKCLGAVIHSGLFFPRTSSLLWDGHSSLLCNYLTCLLILRKMSGGLQSPSVPVPPPRKSPSVSGFRSSSPLTVTSGSYPHLAVM